MPNAGAGKVEKLAAWVLMPAALLTLCWTFLVTAIPINWDWRAIFDGPLRGEWHAVELDELDVSSLEYRIGVMSGEVAVGYDNCNSWGYSETRDPGTGDRMLTTTLVECPPYIPDRAYWTLAHEGAVLELVGDDTLVIRHAGIVGRFERDSDAAREKREAARMERHSRDPDAWREWVEEGYDFSPPPPPPPRPPPPATR